MVLATLADRAIMRIVTTLDSNLMNNPARVSLSVRTTALLTALTALAAFFLEELCNA